MPSTLVIDCGSSSMRGILFSPRGEILHTERREYFMDIDGDAATQDASVYREALYAICSACADELRRRDLTLDALSFTSQRSSVLPVDREGRPLGRIVTWYDKRSLDICREKTAAFGEEILSLAGTAPSPVLSAPKMLLLKRTEPELYRAAYKLIGIHDYLLFLCTGEFVTDVTLASRSNLMDIATLRWSDRLLGIYELDADKLCRLLHPASVAGRLTEDFAAKTGLPAGTAIVSAGGDQQCSALGQGLLEPRQIGITCGTGAYIAAICETPAIDRTGKLDLNAAVCPGLWVAESSIPAAGSVFDWFNRNFYDLSAQSYPQEQINADIAASPAGARGLVMDADLIGGGSFRGVTLSHTRADFARAMAEGIAARLADRYRAVRAQIPVSGVVRTTGGLTKSAEFNQIVSDMIGCPVENCIMRETTAMGAFLAACLALGRFGSFAEACAQLAPRGEGRVFHPCAERAALYAKRGESK